MILNNNVYFTHRNWTPKPAIFNLGDGLKYSPDFYDGERNVFIEMAGTRQAYHFNKEKYELMAKKFPFIKLEIRTSDGMELEKNINGRYIWANITDISLESDPS